MENNFDVIVIGGGPGGISTALYAARGGLSVLVLHNGASALHKAERIENYYGTGAVSGAELYERGIEQAKSVGVSVVGDQATFAEYDGRAFTVTAVGGTYAAKRLVIATGASRLRADIDGIDKFEGKGVSYCAVCDAFFYRKKCVGVVGAGEFAKHEYEAVARVAAETTLFTQGVPAVFVPDKLETRKIARVYGDERLGGVELDDGTKIALDGLFIAVGVMSGASLCKSMGVFTEKNGAVKTDDRGMTNINGLYAVGDCTVGIKQVGKAVSDGVTVGMSLLSDLKKVGA